MHRSKKSISGGAPSESKLLDMMYPPSPLIQRWPHSKRLRTSCCVTRPSPTPANGGWTPGHRWRAERSFADIERPLATPDELRAYRAWRKALEGVRS